MPVSNGLEFIGLTQDAKRVFNRFNSHHNLSGPLLCEALGKVTLGDQSFVTKAVSFERIVGNSTCVRTSLADRIVYARRKRRRGMSRFVLGRQPEPCSNIFLVLKRSEAEPDCYILITGFIGDQPEPEPWDSNASSGSLAFWRNHALVFGRAEIDRRTLVEESPFDPDPEWPEVPSIEDRRPVQHRPKYWRQSRIR